MNKPIIILISALALGFILVFTINSSTVMSTYYKYTNKPRFDCTYQLEGITWDEKCISEHTRSFWYCNGEEWQWKTISCPFGYKCIGGHCKELPHEPAIKIGKFTLSKYTAIPGETIYENILVYNMGTAQAYDKLCTFDATYNDVPQIKDGTYKDMMCYSLFLDGGGASKSLSYPVNIKNTTEIVGYAIYENNKLYTYNFFNVKLNLVKKDVYVNWKPDKYSAMPGDTVTITYDVNVKTLPIRFYAHACILPINWKSKSIIKDYNYYNDICNNVVDNLSVGNHKVTLTLKVPKYGIFDYKYGLGSAWYGYGDYYIIGTSYKYDDEVSDWKYKFNIVNSTSKISTQPIGTITTQNKYYEGIFAIITFGIAIYLYKRYINKGR